MYHSFRGIEFLFSWYSHKEAQHKCSPAPHDLMPFTGTHVHVNKTHKETHTEREKQGGKERCGRNKLVRSNMYKYVSGTQRGYD